jgi:integrase/recombinase XerD
LDGRTAHRWQHLERLKRFFNWCLENDCITSNPAKPLKSPKVGDTDVIPFTEEQVAKILKACEAYEGSNRVRLIILTKFMLASALRIGDAVTISKERIIKSTDGYSVVLQTAKTGVPVSCPLPTDVAKSLLELSDEFPFWTRKSSAEKCASNWRKIFARIFKAAGIDGHPHQFRHTAAKRLLVAGVPVGYVASVLGNSVKICEKHYSKWIVERQHAVDKAVRASWKA